MSCYTFLRPVVTDKVIPSLKDTHAHTQKNKSFWVTTRHLEEFQGFCFVQGKIDQLFSKFLSVGKSWILLKHTQAHAYKIAQHWKSLYS